MMKKIYFAGLITAISTFVIFCLTTICNNIHCLNAHFTPDYEKQSLQELACKATLQEDDYQTLLYQTGLGRPAIDSLYETDSDPQTRLATLETYQNALFAPICWNEVTNFCGPNSFRRQTPAGCEPLDIPMVPLEDGDIILTTASATLGFPNGHIGIVVDAKEGICLEAIAINTNSATCHTTHWTNYANFMVYRLKDCNPEIPHIIASNAVSTLVEKPYSLTVGLLGKKYEPCSSLVATHCAHLVWEAYADYGYDLDSNDGLLVSVDDIAGSDYLELVQLYGVSPDRWN